MQHRLGLGGRVALALVGVTLVFLATALEAGAHAQAYPVAGENLLVRTDQGPGSQSLAFVGIHGVPVGHNPIEDSSAVLVRGVGANAGRTQAITLSPDLWTASGTGGWRYSDPAGTRGGITYLSVESGRLEIQGSLDNWGWSPQGPQDAVWVHFRVEDEWYCAEFPAATASTNAAGHFAAAASPAPAACPEQVCGNGIHEALEECDDGNLETGDGCEATCETGPCNNESFESTFEGIQKVVFESTAYGCTRSSCHDSVTPDGGLDLSHDNAYLSLLGADGLGAPSSEGLLKRVLPTEPNESRLFLKLAAKKPTYSGPDVGTPMPTGLAALSDEHLEAVKLWIRGGAPLDLVVSGTAELLGTCFPPADPLKTPVPDAPPVEAGFQLQQTPYVLYGANPPAHQGETELCMSTYYDLSALVPEEARVPCPEQYQFRKGCVDPSSQFEGTPPACETQADCSVGTICRPIKNATNPSSECFAYNRFTVIQDPQSHHSIVNVYTGGADTSDPGWDDPATPAPVWSYRFEPDDPDPSHAALQNQPCDPLQFDRALVGYNPGCSSEPQNSIACVGYGPGDLGNLNLLTGGGGNLPQLSLSQETYYDFAYPGGVYDVLPVRGIVVWNSHAFNLTQTDSTMAQFVNVEYAYEQDRIHESKDIFDARWIFAQFVPPFLQREVCATYTAPQGTQLFQLSSHTHRHGVKWRTWAPPNPPCRPACPTVEDDPVLTVFGTFLRNLCDPYSPLPLCEGPREDPPLYFSTSYEDPLNLAFDPPMLLDSPNEEDRTFLYCSVYDNGATSAGPPVKRYSTSPLPPDPFGGGPLTEFLGGPCYPGNIACLNDGPNKGVKCGSATAPPDHTFCDSASGASDGVCDACPVHGGVTTEDEMFILLGNYYIPEPAAGALGAAAALALAALARRRVDRGAVH